MQVKMGAARQGTQRAWGQHVLLHFGHTICLALMVSISFHFTDPYNNIIYLHGWMDTTAREQDAYANETPRTWRHFPAPPSFSAQNDHLSLSLPPPFRIQNTTRQASNTLPPSPVYPHPPVLGHGRCPMHFNKEVSGGEKRHRNPTWYIPTTTRKLDVVPTAGSL